MRLTRLMIAVLALAAAAPSPPAFAGPRKSTKKFDEDDPLAKAKNLLNVATLLLRDGHLDRAAGVISEIDIQVKGLDLARYHTLSGLIALKRHDFKMAARQLALSIKHGQKDKNAYLLLAQARFGLKDFRGTLDALAHTGELGKSYAGIFLMKAQCHWRLRDRENAWRALRDGIRRFPKSRELVRQKILLMVDLGLYQQATTLGLNYLARGKAKADDYVAIAEALRRGKQHKKSILILEQAKLQHPQSDLILKQLARSYLDDGKPLAAAELLARAAHRKPEISRRGGRAVSPCRAAGFGALSQRASRGPKGQGAAAARSDDRARPFRRGGCDDPALIAIGPAR
jgi:uncharacterized protein HemY